MEVHEPDEVLEVSVVEEAPAPEESVLSGSEEGEGRHRVATLWIRILQMDEKKFNHALKVIFVVFPLSYGLITLFFMNFILKGVNTPGFIPALPRWSNAAIMDEPDQHVFGGFDMQILCAVSWIFVAIALCAALFALVVDVERPGLQRRPVPKWMVRLPEGTYSMLKECYHMTTTELLPHHRAAHEEASQEHSGLA